MAENLEPTRRQLHDRLDFVATEIESSLVRGESASGVEFETLLGRVRALLAAAVETAAVTAVSGTRRVCAVVDPVATEEAVLAPLTARLAKVVQQANHVANVETSRLCNVFASV